MVATQIFFIFTPKIGEMIWNDPIWRAYFSDGWFNHQLVFCWRSLSVVNWWVVKKRSFVPMTRIPMGRVWVYLPIHDFCGVLWDQWIGKYTHTRPMGIRNGGRAAFRMFLKIMVLKHPMKIQILQICPLIIHVWKQDPPQMVSRGI